MIKIKNKVEPSQAWKDKALNSLNNYKQNINNSPEFQNEIWRELKGKLAENQHNKCCYCESKRRTKYESDVEHFRPKKAPTESPIHPGYWWLAYEEQNYLFSCKNCNEEHKKSFFPLEEESSRCSNFNEYFSDKATYLENINNFEKPLLINPIQDDPELFFTYNDEVPNRVYIIPKSCNDNESCRSCKTIEILNLNETSLKEERGELTQQLKQTAEEMIAYKQISKFDKDKYKEEIKELSTRIKEETSAKKEFTGYRRYFFTKMGLEQNINND